MKSVQSIFFKIANQFCNFSLVTGKATRNK